MVAKRIEGAGLMVTSDRPEWHTSLPFGLPDDFDFACIRTERDALLLMVTLPNRDRGKAALGLVKALGAPLEKRVVYSGLMTAWDHDHREVLSAFGDPQAFANALRKVAEPSGRNRPVRAWRGVSSPHAAYGISWTTDRDVACWFAMRFRDHHRSPMVFVADIPPALIIAEHDERAERELLVDPDELSWERVVLDDGSAEGSEIEAYDVDVDQKPPRRAIDDWQLAAERYEKRKNAPEFRIVTGT
jgi:hypothetical protein